MPVHARVEMDVMYNIDVAFVLHRKTEYMVSPDLPQVVCGKEHPDVQVWMIITALICHFAVTGVVAFDVSAFFGSEWIGVFGIFDFDSDAAGTSVS